MLKISKMADYATRILHAMHQQRPDFCCSARFLAEQTQISLPTVSKILKTLTDYQLVKSTRGVSGGYQLARLPGQINLAEVIQAIDGDTALTACGRVLGCCDHQPICAVKDHWQHINRLVTQLLSQITLLDLGLPLAKFNFSVQRTLRKEPCHHEE